MAKKNKMVKINMKIKSKRGWIRIVEVFVAILLLTSVLVVITNRVNSPEAENLHKDISKKEFAILRDIELNNSLRTEILSATLLPVAWDDFNPELRARITSLTPSNLDCKAKICSINNPCLMDEMSGKNIYAESVFISADLSTYSPRQLKIFCAEK